MLLQFPFFYTMGYRNFIILGTDCNYVEKDIKNVKIEYHPEDKGKKDRLQIQR